MNNNQQSNRLQLNFGFGGGDRNNQYQQEVGRAFPTTPSTFPQPVYPNQAGQQEVWGAQQQGNGNGMTHGGGYFMNPYQQAQYQGQQGNLQAPGSQRFDQSANGLAQQLSHQHLGGNGRSGSPYGRQASPNPGRPRTADNRGGYGYGSQGGSGSRPQNSLYEEEAPPKDARKYSENVEKQAMVSKSLINTFFKDSVQRARDRNQRYPPPAYHVG
jgi:protein-serine/threonine kinase